MFIELVDALRCPATHEESWLVASADRMEARHIVEGVLGCPVCARQFPVRSGVVDFRTSGTVVRHPEVNADDTSATRLAAFMNLTDAQGFALLIGSRGAHAELLMQLVETPLILVDPPATMTGQPGISVIRTDGGALPLARGAARATALDAADATRAAAAVEATRTNGRIVAPAALALPLGVRELARDPVDWVGERESGATVPIVLHVRRG